MSPTRVDLSRDTETTVIPKKMPTGNGRLRGIGRISAAAVATVLGGAAIEGCFDEHRKEPILTVESPNPDATGNVPQETDAAGEETGGNPEVVVEPDTFKEDAGSTEDAGSVADADATEDAFPVGPDEGPESDDTGVVDDPGEPAPEEDLSEPPVEDAGVPPEEDTGVPPAEDVGEPLPDEGEQPAEDVGEDATEEPSDEGESPAEVMEDAPPVEDASGNENDAPADTESLPIDEGATPPTDGGTDTGPVLTDTDAGTDGGPTPDVTEPEPECLYVAGQTVIATCEAPNPSGANGCVEGLQTCQPDGNYNQCAATAPTKEIDGTKIEICNGVDDTCNDEIDEGLIGGKPGEECFTAQNCPGMKECDPGNTHGVACFPIDGASPNATEMCDDKIDNDCDLLVDEGCNVPVDAQGNEVPVPCPIPNAKGACQTGEMEVVTDPATGKQMIGDECIQTVFPGDLPNIPCNGEPDDQCNGSKKLEEGLLCEEQIKPGAQAVCGEMPTTVCDPAEGGPVCVSSKPAAEENPATSFDDNCNKDLMK